jgi:hypothetical protein
MSCKDTILCASASSVYTACGWQLPAFEVVACQSALLELAVQKNLEEAPHAFKVVGGDVKQRYCG